MICTLTLIAALAAGQKPATAPAPAPASKDNDALLTALTDELTRSFKQLKGKGGDAALYYLSYRLNDGQWFQESASYGALENAANDDDPLAGRARYLDVSA